MTTPFSEHFNALLRSTLTDFYVERRAVITAIAALESYARLTLSTSAEIQPVRRGRPAGSRNKPKELRVDNEWKQPALSEKSILVVDDDRLVLGLTRSVLHGTGYHVVAVDNASKALGLSKSGKVQIDLLLTDINMPQMNGFELARQFAEHRPGVPILFMTGHLHPAPIEEGWGTIIIQKPFTPDHLVQTVDEVLRAA